MPLAEGTECENLLRGRSGHLGENGLLARDLGLLASVKVFAQVDEAGLVTDDLKNLSLPIHHVFVLQNLLDCYHFSSFLLLSLHAKNN